MPRSLVTSSLLLATLATAPACDLNLPTLSLGACGESGCLPQDCASLSRQHWQVDGFFVAPESLVAVGASTQSSLSPGLEIHCEGAISSVTWEIEDRAMASLAPQGRFVWITGLAPGLTSLGARITFSDGVQQDAERRALRVVPRDASPRGGDVVAEGSLTIPPYVADRPSSDWRGWVPFTTTRAGRLDVVVGWGSPLNRIDFSGYEGHCSAVARCGRIRMTVRRFGVKPLASTFYDLRTPAGDYTVRIDNLGPGEETVRYEVRLTPG